MSILLIGEYGKFVYVTYLGLFCAVIAMYCFFNGQFAWGMMAFILSGICDLFDGKVANSFKRSTYQKRYGTEIDSLCDMISFAAVPAVLIMTQLTHTIWAIPLVASYVLAAVTRLATFNAQSKYYSSDSSFFIGMPVTYSALVFPVAYIVSETVSPGHYHFILPFLSVAVTYLFVMNHKVAKPKRKAYVFFCLLALVSLVALWRLANG